MPARWVCGYCVAANGLRGADLSKWPMMEDIEAQADHIESVHHVCVIRDGETQQQAEARFAAQYPEAGGPNCRCPACDVRRALKIPFELH